MDCEWNCPTPQRQRGHDDQPGAPQEARRFLNADRTHRLFRWQRPNVRRIHHQRRAAMVNPISKRWTDPRHWRQDQESSHDHNRYEQAPRQIKQHEPNATIRHWHVLAVMLSAVVRTSMVIDMCVVNEGRCEERYTAQQIPYEAKNCQLAIALMDELMDEHARSIEQQTRGEKEKCLRPGAREALVGNE